MQIPWLCREQGAHHLMQQHNTHLTKNLYNSATSFIQSKLDPLKNWCKLPAQTLKQMWHSANQTANQQDNWEA
jgi:hypothetical protein